MDKIGKDFFKIYVYLQRKNSVWPTFWACKRSNASRYRNILREEEEEKGFYNKPNSQNGKIYDVFVTGASFSVI